MSASCSREHQRVDAPHPVKRSASLIPAENNPPKPSPTPALRRLVLASTFACRLTGIFSGTRERFGGRWRRLFSLQLRRSAAHGPARRCHRRAATALDGCRFPRRALQTSCPSSHNCRMKTPDRPAPGWMTLRLALDHRSPSSAARFYLRCNARGPVSRHRQGPTDTCRRLKASPHRGAGGRGRSPSCVFASASSLASVA